MSNGVLTSSEEAQLVQTVEMFEVISQTQPQDYQSLEILKEAYIKLGRENDVIRTSKRIAEAYVLMGQLSSAILEYESILQRRPEDTEVLAALSEIESKANSLTSARGADEGHTSHLRAPGDGRAKPAKAASAAEVDDGRKSMHKILVEGKVVSAADFDACWPVPDLNKMPTGVVEPLLQKLADKGLVPLDKSLRLISDKGRFGYLNLGKYDNDIELGRGFPRATCLRWCVLPFDRMSKSVLVATANPFNKQAAQELEQATKLRLLWYLANPADITKALRKIFR